MPSLSSRVVAITGASAGIGYACAEQLSAAGATVIVSARRIDRLNDLVAAIHARGGRALAVAGDVTIASDMRVLVERAVETFGRLDVMICNAGIGYHAPLEETPVDVMRRVVDVNLMGTFHAALPAIEQFRKQRTGHLIAVSSIVGRRGVGGSSIYAATKAAQVGFIESLRADFHGSGIYASVVFPVATETEFREAIRRDFGHDTKGHGPQQSADTVAAAIVQCVIRPRAEVYPLGKARFLSILNVIAPAFTDRWVQKYRRGKVTTDDADPS